ncbi:hypothetical protein FGG08_006340 [Glutinoglossum americanum]|uniref:Thiamine phosphate synthase n=1 Tax=Glutinoglossum americanum TaxID=1670608 RepID=A0A9P8L206_9PEZI|nr:hypothetical protein FGG08_006340 [Glutinoglossum americanum]
MRKMSVDYSLYLVTDSAETLLRGRDLVEVVKAAVKGGVTIVQFRDKTGETGELVRVAKALHAVTKQYNIPLIVNDRIDVALAVGAEGVHLGQDDIDLQIARKLLGDNAIIGVSVSSVDEAVRAAKGGANYVGIGTLFATSTKVDTKSVIGTAGVKKVLGALSAMDEKVSAVAIGGVNLSNVQRVIYQSKASFKALDGIAVVSAIIAAPDPTKAAKELKGLTRQPPAFAVANVQNGRKVKGYQALIQSVPAVVKMLGQARPLCHNMTNLVVQNFAANVSLAIGASPIMSSNGGEAADLARLKGSLVINMGTVTPDGLEAYIVALRAYNMHGGPVILDPVGAGATRTRRDAVNRLLSEGYFDMIKGNEQEIKSVLGEENLQQNGVDSGGSALTDNDRARLAKKLASRERNVVLMTGPTDFLSDGERTFAVNNGHEYLGKITGSGCTLGTTVASCLAIQREDKLLAALSGVLLFEIAAEHAGLREDVKGPGTFVPAFIDELYHITKQTAAGNNGWLAASKINEMELSLEGAVECADKSAFSMWVPEIQKHFKLEDGPYEIAVVGIESHICVTQTTIDLLANGHKVYVLADGVSSCNPQEVPIALDRLRKEGAVVTTSESFLFECMGDAGIGE